MFVSLMSFFCPSANIDNLGSTLKLDFFLNFEKMMGFNSSVLLGVAHVLVCASHSKSPFFVIVGVAYFGKLCVIIFFYRFNYDKKCEDYCALAADYLRILMPFYL